MAETIHHFRQYVYQMDYMTDYYPDLDDGCNCPACFEVIYMYFHWFYEKNHVMNQRIQWFFCKNLVHIDNTLYHYKYLVCPLVHQIILSSTTIWMSGMTSYMATSFTMCEHFLDTNFLFADTENFSKCKVNKCFQKYFSNMNVQNDFILDHQLNSDEFLLVNTYQI